MEKKAAKSLEGIVVKHKRTGAALVYIVSSRKGIDLRRA